MSKNLQQKKRDINFMEQFRTNDQQINNIRPIVSHPRQRPPRTAVSQRKTLRQTQTQTEDIDKEFFQLSRSIIIKFLQSLRQKVDSFPINSKSDYFINNILATLNQDNCTLAKFQQQIVSLLTGLQFHPIPSVGPICRQKKSSLRYYRCFNCEINGIRACFCEQCFQEQIHKDHSFKIYPQACHCDCGDYTIFNLSSFCKKHKDFTTSNQMTFEQYSTFYDCFQFLFFLSFELNSLTSHRQYGNKIIQQSLTIAIKYLKDSYEYKKVLGKLLFSSFRSNYKITQICIFDSISKYLNHKVFNQKIILSLYEVPSFRSTLIQKYWNCYLCNNSSSYVITQQQQIANLLISEVSTIISLLQEQKIAPFDVSCIEGNRRKLWSFFTIHIIMKEHKKYSQFIELTSIQYKFFKENIAHSNFDIIFEKLYLRYVINIVKVLSKSESGISMLKNIVKQAYRFMKSETKKDKNLEKYRINQARACFSLALFALYKFQTNHIQQQTLPKLLQLFDEQTQLYLLVEQNYQQILHINEYFQKLKHFQQHFQQKNMRKYLCLLYLELKIFLILQAKIEKDLRYDFTEFQFEADVMNNQAQLKTLILYQMIIYVVETDFFEVVLANELAHAQIQKLVHFLKMIISLANREDKILVYKNCRDWIFNFNELRMQDDYPQLYNITQPEQSLYYHNISFTSPIILIEGETKLISFFNMKKKSKSQRSNLSKHFFSQYLQEKIQVLSEFFIQRLQKTYLNEIIHFIYLNKWFMLSSLLYLETKRQFYQLLTLKLISKYSRYFFTNQNQLMLQKAIYQNICQDEKHIYQPKKQQQIPKAEQKHTKAKREKLMNKIKQMQQNYIKKIEPEKLETKGEQHVCLICKMPNNLFMLCNAIQNQFLYANRFGFKKSFLMITSCGHLVHQKCIAPISRPGRRRQGQEERIRRVYFKCQLCKKQANLVIPVVETCNQSLEGISKQIQYLEEDIQLILINNRRNQKKLQSQTDCYKFDQILFESIIFSAYFFFNSDPKYFNEKVIKNIIAFLRLKLKIKGINIRPTNINIQEIIFKNLQQVVALLIYHKQSVKDKMILQIQQKIQQLQLIQTKTQTTELLKLFLCLLGQQKYKLSEKYGQNLNLFNLPQDLLDLNKITNKCETCNRLSPSNSHNLTNQIFICLICGLISCSKCQHSSKKLHPHQFTEYNLNCQYGTLNGYFLYTDQFGIGPQKNNTYILKVRSLYKLNQKNYQKVLNCLYSSNSISNRMNYYNDREENIYFDHQIPQIYLPRATIRIQKMFEQQDWEAQQDPRGNLRARGMRPQRVRRGPRERGFR